MMAADSSNSPASFTVFVLLSMLVSVTSSSADGKNVSTECVDGTYEHTDGKDKPSTWTCCLCNAGQHVESHCTPSQKHGICKSCERDMYSSHPNNQESCEHCTSCSHPSENLEVDEPCTRARDTKCRCKKGHYCSSDTETCRMCYPCKECVDVGIKVPCTAKKNTVCNDKSEGGIGAKVGISVALLLLLIGLVVFLALFSLKKKRDRRRQHSIDQLKNGSVRDVEMQRLTVPVVDLQRYMPDIAEAIGWKDMRDVAMRSDILNTTIDGCEMDHPRDSQEQTLQLLKIWEEKQGREASRKLIQILENNDRRSTAERVAEILSTPNPPA